MRLSGAARWPELQTKTQNEDVYITILVLQIMQISEVAGAACHGLGEGYQCPARWMSLTRAECHSDGGPRAGSEGETSCTSFWIRAVRNSRCRQTMKHGYDALNMRSECRKFLVGRAMSRKKDSGEEL